MFLVTLLKSSERVALGWLRHRAVRSSALSAAPWADWLDWTTDGWWGVSKTTLERLGKIKKTYDSDINFL